MIPHWKIKTELLW